MVKVAYLETSAAIKLVLLEPEREAFIAHISDSELVLTASWLLYTEMHCAAGRHPEAIPVEKVLQAIDQVELVDVSRNDLISAGRFAPLRSNGAIHLAVALRLQVEEIITYDQELIEVATRFGLRAVSPS